jgi:hypothetical protein
MATAIVVVACALQVIVVIAAIQRGGASLGVELNPNPGKVGFGLDSDRVDRADSNPKRIRIRIGPGGLESTQFRESWIQIRVRIRIQGGWIGWIGRIKGGSWAVGVAVTG